MPITNPAAVKFSNEHIRTSADRLAQIYDGCRQFSLRWTALGSGQEAVDALTGALKPLADFIGTESRNFLHNTALIWQLHQIHIGTVIVPNNGQDIVDGSPSDGRAQITGAQANLVIDRIREHLFWLDQGTDTWTNQNNNGGGGTNLYQVLDVGSLGRVHDLTRAGNFVNRCNALVTNMEASTNAKLNTVLAAAVQTAYRGDI